MEGATPGESELLAYSRERLARFKCPAAIEFAPLRRTAIGKVQT